jgi:hypothetical protein
MFDGKMSGRNKLLGRAQKGKDAFHGNGLV